MMISIEQTIPDKKDGIAMIKEPKTKTSIRKVYIPSFLIDKIREYQIKKKKQRLKYGAVWGYGKYDFVFSDYTGEPYNPNSLHKWFKRFLENKGLRHVRFHDLRHTTASILISRGIHAKVISEYLGHADIQTTMDIYGHLFESEKQKVSHEFDQIFGESTVTTDLQQKG